MIELIVAVLRVAAIAVLVGAAALVVLAGLVIALVPRLLAEALGETDGTLTDRDE